MIDVVISVYDKDGTYSKYAGVTIESLLQNTRDSVHIHLFHDSTITNTNLKKFTELVNNHNQKISFYLVDISSKLERLETVKQFTIGTLFRLRIGDLIPDDIDKILYIDADTLVNLDISDLWNYKFDDKTTVMAVKDQGFFPPNSKQLFENGILIESNYINAGVLFINLKKMRERHDLYGETVDFLKKYPKAPFPDQDAINYIFRDEIKYLSNDYNSFTLNLRGKELTLENRIYHYAGDRPHAVPVDSFDLYFYKVLERTPWGNVENIVDYYVDQQTKVKSSVYAIRNVVKNIRNKRMVFWGASGIALKKIMSLFTIDYEYDYIVDNTKKMWGQIINGLVVKKPENIKHDNNIYIIVVSNLHYNEIKEQLESYGKIENQDFLNGKLLLTEDEIFI